MRIFPILATALALTACAESTEPDPTPANDGGVPYTKIDPVPTPTATANASAVAGTWRSDNVRGRPAVLYQPAAGGGPIAAIYCDERRGLVIERRGMVPTGEIDMMGLAAGNERQDLAVAPVEGSQEPVLRAAIPFNAELIATLQREPLPLTIDVGEGETISLPGTPLIPQLVNTCRTNS